MTNDDGSAVVGLLFLIYLGTSLWVLFDAKKLGVQGKGKRLLDMGVAGWFFSCLLFWIVAFPLYLMRRGGYKERHRALVAQMIDIPTQLEKLAALKERGVISNDEFQSKKKELLVRM